MTAVVEQFMHQHCAGWADEPVPLLGNKTPRQTMATAAGLERVKGLIREYEANEARMAQGDGGNGAWAGQAPPRHASTHSVGSQNPCGFM